MEIPDTTLQPLSAATRRAKATRSCPPQAPVAQGRGVQRAVLAFWGAHLLSTESKGRGFPFASSAIARNRAAQRPEKPR